MRNVILSVVEGSTSFSNKCLGIRESFRRVVSDLNIHSTSNASGIKTQFHSDKL